MSYEEGLLIANRFELRSELGSSPRGCVWAAEDRVLDSRCAVKLVHPDRAGDPDAQARLSREAKVTAQVRNPHVVDVFASGVHQGLPYLAMELLLGENLRDRLRRVGRLDLASAYRIVSHVARALTTAHTAQVSHRNLRSSSVYLVVGDDGDIAKVLDFGVVAGDEPLPEDALGPHRRRRGGATPSIWDDPLPLELESQADLWSLALIGFECITGRSPIVASSFGQRLARIFQQPVPMPREICPSLPPALDAWWSRATARDLGARFRDARELADAFGDAVGSPVLHSVPPPPVLVPSNQGGVGPGEFDLPIPRDAALPHALITTVDASPALAATINSDAVPLLGRMPSEAPVTHTRHSIPVVELAGSERQPGRRWMAHAIVAAVVSLSILGLLAGWQWLEKAPSSPRANLASVNQPSRVEEPSSNPHPASEPEQSKDREARSRVTEQAPSASEAAEPRIDLIPASAAPSIKASPSPRRTTPARSRSRSRPRAKPNGAEVPDYGI